LANNSSKQKDSTNGLWYKCETCNEPRFSKELARNLMICPKCGNNFPIKAVDLVEGIFDEDEFSEIQSLSNAKTLKLVLDIGNAIAIAIDNPQIDQESIHLSECLAFMDAVKLSVDEHIPFISIYANLTAYDFLIQPKIALLAAAVNKLSKQGIPHITVLANTNSKDSFITYFPMGDIVIADNPKNDSKANPENKVNKNGIHNNELDSNEVSIDMRVDRRKLADVLENLIKFFS